ncbi:CYTH domain-containing protein [Bacillus canaveralius]|uniref:CYTH domain-containing protein n=1 Tax=Bacillus canaveralius TaxID=1403243 RepID=UPI000F7767C9|nr:CYTH domain-containing protein [Bacillus canaveralius]RSK48669.1 CYTH domain-containing protein [Bacillus canaveralius]
MPQHLEIECKNLLTEDEFNRLKGYFKIADSAFRQQVNSYFDTKDFLLKQNGTALRIREIGNNFELTLKQPGGEGLLETNQPLTANEAAAMLTSAAVPEGQVKEILKQIPVPVALLENFGSLTTFRAEIEFRGGLLVFDHSYYLNIDDYEVEYEVEEKNSGEKIFIELLSAHDIPIRATKNKVKRFYDQKYIQLNS